MINKTKTMKTINKNTVLKKGNEIYKPVEVDGVIYVKKLGNG